MSPAREQSRLRLTLRPRQFESASRPCPGNRKPDRRRGNRLLRRASCSSSLIAALSRGRIPAPDGRTDYNVHCGKRVDALDECARVFAANDAELEETGYHLVFPLFQRVPFLFGDRCDGQARPTDQLHLRKARSGLDPPASLGHRRPQATLTETQSDCGIRLRSAVMRMMPTYRFLVVTPAIEECLVALHLRFEVSRRRHRLVQTVPLRCRRSAMRSTSRSFRVPNFISDAPFRFLSSIATLFRLRHEDASGSGGGRSRR